MRISIQIGNMNYLVDQNEPLDISIPLNFNGAQPNAYGVERAKSEACQAGEIVGDTRRGGSCNFEQYKFIPHCNGTHTESIGHVTRERISINDCLREAFVKAALISVAPEKSSENKESYAIETSGNDFLITARAIENALKKIDAVGIEALIVRTLPNDREKLTKVYQAEIPPFFSTEAMRLIVEKKVRHLLVDTPSIDRLFDEGKLSNHRIFWNIEQGSFEANENAFISQTITELIFVADEIADGHYLLNLQIPPFQTDAAPSRPLIYKLK